jgi:hypothetical protein
MQEQIQNRKRSLTLKGGFGMTGKKLDPKYPMRKYGARGTQ